MKNIESINIKKKMRGDNSIIYHSFMNCLKQWQKKENLKKIIKKLMKMNIRQKIINNKYLINQ